MTSTPVAPELLEAIPTGYDRLEQTGYLGWLDGIWIRRHTDRAETILLPLEHHANPNGYVHGGVILSLLDFTLGVTAEVALRQPSDMHPATVSLTTHFIGGASGRDLLHCAAEVLKQTRSFSFVEGRITSGGEVIATASAVFKNPNPKPVS
jgi:uncharacterized protein (TIGR00369 family)